MNLKEELKKYFGYNSFRGDQESIIKSVLLKKDAFVIMPTGAGKSLCYQLPAVLMEGTAIVISPLIALMKNQVDQLNAHGIQAHFLNSTLSKSEATRVKKSVLAEKTKLLYVAPESLTKEENVDFLSKANISFVAVDEVHCISEWGHDFRPEYRKIRTILRELGEFPVIALTATATPKVQLDIQKNLNLEDAELYKSSFLRDNLFYEVRPKTNSKKQLITYVKQFKGQSGIIYCLSRKKAEELADLLQVNNINALPYHAGLEQSVRMKNQDAFLNEEVDVITATIAFGMGIDKPDVRYVVHYDAPKSLEGYYQETGRAGRDSLQSNCLMFYSYSDIVKLEKFNKDKTVSERDNARQLLDELVGYAESSTCRTRQLLNYFGERTDEDCGNCDNCKNPKDKFEAKDDLLLALQAIEQTKEHFGFKHVADVIKGSEAKAIKSNGHVDLMVWGKGKSHDAQYWASILRQGLINGFLDKDIEQYGVLKLTEKGKDFIKNPFSIEFVKDHEYPEVGEEEDTKEKDTVKSYDKELFALLKQLRKTLGQKKGLPPFVIFQETSLQEMATIYPITKDDLTRVNGVGIGKATKFGKPFLDLIQKYVKEKNIEPQTEVVIKSTFNKFKAKIFIIQQIDRKMNLDEIASARNMSFDELLDEIERICFSGTRLNLDYHLNDILDEEDQDEIFDYFMEAETDSIEEAFHEFEEVFTEEELRLMRIKFLSEVGN
ncbi:MAG: DNA helicase RecQ [Cytophagales bacterium]|nr:DNA helicase RecQ [Cytophagales bacterium]